MKSGSLFERLHSIKSTDITPENWQTVQPCWNISVGNSNFVLTQPLSSFLVYLLGFETLWFSFSFLQVNDPEQTHMWWFLSLLLWGLGALIAGSSYQAFGYYIKCHGRALCTWTSWWEIIYLLLQKLSVDTMLVAVVYSCIPPGNLRNVVFGVTAIFSAIYVILIVYGSFKPVKKLITFETMVLFCMPVYTFLLGLNGYRYFMYGNELDLFLIAIWISLVLILLLYYAYLKLGWTQVLWHKKIWFSENDVLHVGLIIWIAVIGLYLPEMIRDL